MPLNGLNGLGGHLGFIIFLIQCFLRLIFNVFIVRSDGHCLVDFLQFPTVLKC